MAYLVGKLEDWLPLNNAYFSSSANQETETDRKVQLFQRVLRESPLGKILAAIDEYDIRQDMTSSYLNDYVHYVYHAKSEEELAVSQTTIQAQPSTVKPVLSDHPFR